MKKLLDELAQRQSAEDMLRKLGEALSLGAVPVPSAGGQAKQGGAEGDLSAAGEMLGEMEQLEQEMAELDAAMSELASMKNQAGGRCACGKPG